MDPRRAPDSLNRFGQDGLIGLTSTGGLDSAVFCACWIRGFRVVHRFLEIAGIALPNAPPTSPSLLGPKMIRMITSSINRCDGAKISISASPEPTLRAS